MVLAYSPPAFAMFLLQLRDLDSKEDGLPGAGRLDVGGVHATPVGMVLDRMRKRDGAE